jgi:two-component system chemotaxis response regulator CheY
VNDILDATDTSSSTILIVDDDADMRYLARAVLEGSGMEVAEEAADGTEALAKFAELDPPPVPTVVLLDNQMPGLSGLEVASRILKERPDQLIVLFSAYLDAEIVSEAERLCVAACVSKGDAMDLASIIAGVVTNR